jgi:hypothetical protein
MELDTNSPVSDEQRRLAESKKLTLQPVHSEVIPEDLPDAEIAARHMNEPAIANAKNDTEQDVAVIQPSGGLLQEQRTEGRTNGLVIATVAVAISITLLFGVFYFFM